MPQVMKISQEGYDVHTATDLQLIFDSELDTANIVTEGTSSQTGSNQTLTFTIAHGLSFTPYVLGFYRTSVTSGKWRSFPGGLVPDTDGDYTNAYYLKIDSTNVKFEFYVGSSVTVYLRYYIFNLSI